MPPCTYQDSPTEFEISPTGGGSLPNKRAMVTLPPTATTPALYVFCHQIMNKFCKLYKPRTFSHGEINCDL